MNGPAATVISGDDDAVLAVADEFRERGHKVTRLRVSHAFHSPRIDPILGEFAAVAGSLSYAEPLIPVVSNLTGRLATAGELRDPQYWVAQARHAVRFADGIATLRDQGVTTYLEVGPDAVLTPMAGSSLPDGLVPMPVLRARRPEAQTFLTALAHAHAHGTPVDWAAFFAGHGTGKIDLPTYAFQHRDYWIHAATLGRRPDAGPGMRDGWFWDAVELADMDALSSGLALSAAQRASLSDLLPALSAWRRQQSEPQSYRLRWEPSTGQAHTLAASTWLLLAPGPEPTDVEQALTAAGIQVVNIPVTASAEDPEQFRSQLREQIAAHQEVSGVLSLLDQDDGAATAARARLALTPTVLAAGVLDDLGVAGPLWIVTREAVEAAPGDPPPDTGRAWAWGLGQELAAHGRGRARGLIDLPHRLEPAMAGLLGEAMAAGRTEQAVAVRSSGIFVRRLVPVAVDRIAHGSGKPFEPHGTVVVAGAVTELGEHLVRWIAGHPAAHVLLAVPPADADTEAVAGLRADLDGRITVRACDLADRMAASDLLAAVPPDHPATAVVHVTRATGEQAGEPLSPGRIEADAAEAAAVTNLDELASQLALALFLLITPVADALSAPGPGAQGLLQAQLDAIVGRRRSAGHPAFMLQAAMPGGRDQEPGRRPWAAPVRPDLVTAIIERVPEMSGASLLLADFDWAELVAQADSQRSLSLFGSIPAVRDRSGDGDGSDLPALHRSLADVPEAARLDLIMQVIRGHLAGVLGHAEASAIDEDSDLVGLGLSSFAAMELSTRMRTAGLAISAAVIFDHPTLAGLAHHVCADLNRDTTAHDPTQ